MGRAIRVLLCLGDKGEHLWKALPSPRGSWQEPASLQLPGLSWGVFLEEAGLEQRSRGGWCRDEASPWTTEAYLPYSRAWEVRQLRLFLGWTLGEER